MDTVQCGRREIPCRTIAFAISKTEDGDFVNIDGGVDSTSPYVYGVSTKINIMHSITIQKCKHLNGRSPRPIIENRKARSTTDYVLYVTISITILSIRFSSIRLKDDPWLFHHLSRNGLVKGRIQWHLSMIEKYTTKDCCKIISTIF